MNNNGKDKYNTKTFKGVKQYIIMTVNKEVYRKANIWFEKLSDYNNYAKDYSNCLEIYREIRKFLLENIIQPYNFAKSLRKTTKEIKDGTFKWSEFKKEVVK